MQQHMVQSTALVLDKRQGRPAAGKTRHHKSKLDREPHPRVDARQVIVLEDGDAIEKHGGAAAAKLVFHEHSPWVAQWGDVGKPAPVLGNGVVRDEEANEEELHRHIRGECRVGNVDVW